MSNQTFYFKDFTLVPGRYELTPGMWNQLSKHNIKMYKKLKKILEEEFKNGI